MRTLSEIRGSVFMGYGVSCADAQWLLEQIEMLREENRQATVSLEAEIERLRQLVNDVAAGRVKLLYGWDVQRRQNGLLGRRKAESRILIRYAD